MSARFSIVIVKGPSVGETYSFDQTIVSIGRTAAENDLVLNDRSISGKHARITAERGKVYLQDLRSTNGTYYDGETLQDDEKIRLEHRDEFSLGKVVLEYLELKDAETDSADRDAKEDYGSIPGTKVETGEKISLFKRKPFRIILTLFILFFGILFAWKIFDEPEMITGPKDLSEQPVVLPAKGSYGYTKTILTRPDKAVFKFTAKSERIDLVYDIGGIDSDGEVSIILNGTKIANAPLASGKWVKGAVLHLPFKHLIKNGENTMVFDNTKNPPGKERWVVKNLYIEFLQPETCDAKEGKRLFSLGEELFHEKTVSDINIYLACQYYKEAVSFSEECRPRPEFLTKAEKQLFKALKELESRYKDLKFAYAKSMKLGNKIRAEVILKEMLRLIPDKKDLRHIDAKANLKKLTERRK